MASDLTAQPNPFVGARPFREADEGRFFAREKKLAELLDKLGGQDVSLLLAESAAGKSSLLNAGLGPALRRQRLAGLLAAELRIGLPTRIRALPVFVRNWHEGRYYLPCVYEAVRQSLADQKAFNDRLLERLQSVEQGLLDELRVELDMRREDDPRYSKVTKKIVALVLTKDNEILETAAENLGDQHGQTLEIPHEDRGMVALSDALVRSIGGDVVLVMDQFEEILRRERDGGTQSTVLSGVQAVSRALNENVHQLISMRQDFFYLLQRAWPGAASWHEDLNLTTLAPLQLQEGRLVVLRTIERANKTAQRLGWREFAIPDDEFLVGALLWFSAPGVSLKQRPLHQLSLNAFLETLCGEESGNIDRATFDQVRFRRAGGDLAPLTYEEINKNPVLLRNAVLNEHLQRELDKLDGELVRWKAAVCRCLFARVAHELSSAAETKVPVTRERLERVGFDEEYREGVRFLPSGEARVHELSHEGDGARWARETLFDRTQGCLTHLTARLREGNILKPSDSEATWELVHDGFAAPVAQWATDYRRRPEYFLRWLGAPPASDIQFPTGDTSRAWHELLDDYTGSIDEDDVPGADGRDAGLWDERPAPNYIVRGALLKDCKISGADFTGVAFHDCDFEQSYFEGCTFSNQDIVNCNFSWALLGEGCSFDGVRFRGCTMRTTRFGDEGYDDPMPLRKTAFVGVMSELLRIENAWLDGVELLSSGLVGVGGAGTRATPVRSHGEHGTKALDMVYCTVSGRGLRFTECELGAALFDRVKVDPSATITFANVSMRNGLLMEAPDPTARTGAGRRGRGPGSAVLVATHCDFTGSVFRNCTLSGARFRGVNLRRVILRGCDLTSARFLPTKTGDVAVDGLHIPAEQLVMQGCRCEHTEFRRHILDRCVVTRCGGTRLDFKDCTLIGAALFDLDDWDDPAAPEQASWWSGSARHDATEGSRLVVAAAACLVDQPNWSSPDGDGVSFLAPESPPGTSRRESGAGNAAWPWTPTIYTAGPWNSLPLSRPSDDDR